MRQLYPGVEDEEAGLVQGGHGQEGMTMKRMPGAWWIPYLIKMTEDR